MQELYCEVNQVKSDSFHGIDEDFWKQNVANQQVDTRCWSLVAKLTV